MSSDFLSKKKTNIEKKSLTQRRSLRYVFFMEKIDDLREKTNMLNRYVDDLRSARAKFDQLLAAGRLAAAVRAHSRALRIAGAAYDAALAAHDAAVAAAKETP